MISIGKLGPWNKSAPVWLDNALDLPTIRLRCFIVKPISQVHYKNIAFITTNHLLHYKTCT